MLEVGWWEWEVINPSDLIRSTAPSGLKIRPDKCSIFYERRSGNRWYKAKSDKPPEIKIDGEVIEVLKRNGLSYISENL